MFSKLNPLDLGTIYEVHSQDPSANRRYSKGRFLGKGGFARVYELKCLDTLKTYAAKIVPKASLTKQKAKDKVVSEICVHKSLTHAHIVKLEHYFEDNENVYILLELCPNQTLNELVRRRKRLTELEVQCYMLQIISALRHCHAAHVVHRDLKVGNLFLNDRLQVKLGDFGLAGKLDSLSDTRKTVCGTPNYIAPEILEGKRYGYQVDIWSLGVVLYTMLIGTPPFETNNVKKTYNLVKMNAYSFPEKVPISDEAKSLITRILKTNPDRRPSLTEILQHPFFHKGLGIPKTLPISTLAMPPPESFTRQFLLGSPQESLARPSPDTVPVHRKLKSSLSSLQCMLSTQRASPEPLVWVRSWLDYSSKYGLGYVLSNGCTGVYFNDDTKLVSGSSAVHYIQRDESKKDKTQVYSWDSCPSSLENKLALLQKFRERLAADRTEETADVYVKKWIKTKNAVVFRMSSQAIQIVFKDKTELCFPADAQTVVYQDKAGTRNELALPGALASEDKQLKKRLKYSKEILCFLSKGPAVK